MSPVFFRTELEGVATFWRIMRNDGVSLGFTSHNRDLRFDGVLHRAAPGMLPSAIYKSADLSPDSAEVQGVLTHSAIRSADLAEGRYDSASIQIGAVNWETLDRATLYHGTLGPVKEESGGFVAELHSAKAALNIDYVPRTSPTCRAQFCGAGCTLSASKYMIEAIVSSVDIERNAVSFAAIDQALFVGGELRWFNGMQCGLRTQIIDLTVEGLILDRPLAVDIAPGNRARLLEGCNHTLATCGDRFSNAINFQGEPHLPGNDLLARYPLPQ
ncbi:DUF2163 domain-containing protein [Pontixanthobacter gangjinensis]|uniref:DUF2163 domain-containing protein n=1 Tax=Pontixanthobacter gangjinensis TaxID=1028742 RepID=A0A6I4SIR7_9SPHN|nr:DUF2163 domain-containing protein [Pontixanthobacter gangjinensis]MXO55515.1 DUF2163 domain-containing protein [Pontixanthobacter gangjinensis]